MSSAITIGVVGAAAGAYSSNQAAGAASSAAGDQKDASVMSWIAQQKLNKQNRADSEPYRESGYNALNQLNYLMGLGSSSALAETQDNFDPAAYKNWMLKQEVDKINAKYTGTAKKEAKGAKLIAKQTAKINALLSSDEKAWAHYNKKHTSNPTLYSGDFWYKRDTTGQPASQNGEGYGFLQQRFNNDVFEKDPGYQFRMDEGNRAIEGGAAARGGLLSGAAAKAMQKYSQGFASNEYGNAYNRFTGDQQNMYNRLSNLAGLGQQQVNQTAQISQTGLSNASSYLQDAANASASGKIGANNARQSGYGQIGNTLMDAYGIYSANQKKTGWGNGSNGYGTAPDGMQTDYGRVGG